jgi:hypothetical protein
MKESKRIGSGNLWKGELRGAKTAPKEAKLPQKTAPANLHRQRTERKVAMAFHPRPSLYDFYGRRLGQF